MTSNYKYTRNWENQQKKIFDSVGEYDIPVIEPEEYHHVDWIPFNKAKNAGVSNSQLYKQAGNSVTVPVIRAIAEKIVKVSKD